MSNKKIWSLPLVLVTAMLLVGLFAAAVLAQTATSPPRVANQIPAQTLMIGPAATDVDDVSIDLTDVDSVTADAQPAFTDTVDTAGTADTTLVYTAATYDRDIVSVAGLGEEAATATAWWDALGDIEDNAVTTTVDESRDNISCEAKSMRLGFSLTAKTDSTQTRPDNAPATYNADGTEDDPAIGFCQDSDAISGDLHAAAGSTVAVVANAATIAAAFHWDMLSGPEMAAVARGASASGNYAHNFGALSHAQKVQVLAWFGDENVLARGTGSITLDHDGINGVDTDADPEGKAGETTVVVKASDAQGRLIPPGNGSATVGQSFKVTASLTPTGDIADFGSDTSTNTQLTALERSGVHFVAAAGEGTTATPARYDVSINVGADEVATVNAITVVATLAPHHQKLEFHIVSGASDVFGVRPTSPAVLNQAEIYVRSGVTLEPLMEKSFTLQVNEAGNAAANNIMIEVNVTVVSGAQVLATTGTMPDADNPIGLTEDDTSDSIIVKSKASADADPTVLYDFAVNVEDDTPDESLTYTLTGSFSPFTLGTGADRSKLMISGDGIAVTTAAVEDDPDTADVVETAAAARPEGDSGTLDVPTSDFSDITYTFSVQVTDASGNTVTIPVVVKVDVNEPVSVSEATGTGEYVSTDPLSHTIIDVGALVDGGNESGDTLIYSMVTTPTVAPFLIDTQTGEIQISFPGRVYEGGQEWTGTVEIRDSYANTPLTESTTDAAEARDPDATVTVTITAVEGDPPDREHVEVSINEDHDPAVDVVDLKNHAGLAGKFVGAEEYDVVGGDGEDVFSILDSASGVVTLNSDADLDVDAAGTDESYLLSVSVTGPNNVNLGEISVVIDVDGVNEVPEFAMASSDGAVPENAQTGAYVNVPNGTGTQVALSISASDHDAGDTLTFAVQDTTQPFETDATLNTDGSYSVALKVSGNVSISDSPYSVVVVATDSGALTAMHTVEVTVGDINDPPEFDAVDATTNTNIKARTISENTAAGTTVATYTATDMDAPTNDVIQGIHFVLRDATDTENFSIANDTVNGESIGTLTVADGANLEYDIQQDSPAPVKYTIEVNVCDKDTACNELTIIVTLDNSNDEIPVIGNDDGTQDVAENSPRGTSLGDYGATDKDNINQPGFDTITYALTGTHADYFHVSDSGELMTLASLDYDRVNSAGVRTGVPCLTCEVTVVATDEAGQKAEQDVRISVTDTEDSLSTVKVSKANPVPGISQGNPMSALAGTKLTMAGERKVLERPKALPAVQVVENENFVDTGWANWGTVLRIEIAAESPGVNCGNGNQCVIVTVNSDSADDTLHLQAYRSASKENKFVAAVELVEYDGDSTNDDAINGVFMHHGAGGGVAKLSVDEEDEIEIEFGNLRDTVDVENEAPEVSNFAPEHERAFDDADVDYTFTITDDQSGLPEPADLPDTNGDDEYMPVVALISKARTSSDGVVGQCKLIDTSDTKLSQTVIEASTHIHDMDALYCPGSKQDGEYIASDNASGSWGFASIRDDKDFDDIDKGYDVETTIVLTENHTYFVTFIVCDNAGNCAYHDPDGNDDDEELAEITVDTEDPVFVEARTGLNWDSTDNEYDDNRSYIQVIFNDLTTLNASTVEIDDFVVEGHTIKSVTVYENPDADDVNWADSDRYAEKGNNNLRGIDRYRDLENAVFVELEDELLADETPDVTIVPNGVEDGAGNEQDDGDHEADDWISPKFTVVSITSTLETAQDEVLAGDGDEITLVVTADERLDATRPTVVVTYVNAPAGSVDTKGVATCDTSDGADKGSRDRGEIVNTDNCQDSSAAKGGTLNNSVEKVSNTEWIVTVTEPKDTGYYSFRISGVDRSPQENPGSEGIAAG